MRSKTSIVTSADEGTKVKWWIYENSRGPRVVFRIDIGFGNFFRKDTLPDDQDGYVQSMAAKLLNLVLR